MNNKRIEKLLYGLAFLLALTIRLLTLGCGPLSDFEAEWALQSLALAQGDAAVLGPQPAYVFPTAILFYLLGDSTALARFLPALAGSLLVVVPYAFRRRLGSTAALAAAFGLAVDPGMVAMSRLTGGPMLAAAFTVLACALLYSGHFGWGGIAAGLALLSGPSAIMGFLGIGLAYTLARLVGVRVTFLEAAIETDAEGQGDGNKQNLRTFLIFGGGTILLIGTAFGVYPAGLGAWAATLTTYLQGWGIFGGVPAGRLPVILFVYGLLPLVFGLAAIIRGWIQNEKTAQFLSIWFVLALILPILYPGRQAGDLIWAMIPLWVLAGQEIARSIHWGPHWYKPLALATAVAVLMVIMWLNLAGLGAAHPDSVQYYWLVLAASVVIAVLTVVLVYLTWSWEVARTGMVWGVLVGLGIFTVANMFWASQVRPNSPTELWNPAPATRHADAFVKTLESLALAETGHAAHIEVLSLVEAPSLRWAVRNIEGINYAHTFDPEGLEKVIVTLGDTQTFPRQDIYRGQEFGWWDTPDWHGAVPPEPIRWLTKRAAPVHTEKIILWARLDLFPEEIEGETTETEASPLTDDGVEH